MSLIANIPQDFLDRHHAWHSSASHPGFPTRMIPMGDPGSGLEFLTFHRNFINDVRAWYSTQPGSDPSLVAPWTSVPGDLKQSMLGWDASRAAVEDRLTNDLGSFASADDLGIYIEWHSGIHGWLHNAAASWYMEPILASFHSPQSTYFYQLHGLVDHWWTRWTGRVVLPKSRLKDIIDTEPKATIRDKAHTKDFMKEVVREKLEKELKEGPEKPVKEKDKEKDIVEEPFQRLRDPSELILPIVERLEMLERQVAGQAFIRPEERPEVGMGPMRAAPPEEQEEPEPHAHPGLHSELNSEPASARKRPSSSSRRSTSRKSR